MFGLLLLAVGRDDEEASVVDVAVVALEVDAHESLVGGQGLGNHEAFVSGEVIVGQVHVLDVLVLL